MRSVFRAALLVFLFTQDTYVVAQTTSLTVTGILTGKNGNPIPGCNVIVKGKTSQTNTQLCGEFTIDVPDNAATLVFSCLAFRTWEVPVKKLVKAKCSVIVLNDWKDFDNGSCSKNYAGEKRIKIR